jgi:hypothetical protein
MTRLAASVVIVALSAAGPLAFPASASSPDAQFKSGTFVGTVTDSDGNPVSGAVVLLTNTANGLSRKGTTSAEGTYSMVNIQPGTYDFRVSLGSSTMFERRGVVIRGGDIARVDTQLRTTVKASAPSQSVDTRQVQVSLYTYGADGRPADVAAIGGASEFTSFITADTGLCSLRTYKSTPDAGFRIPSPVAWRITGRVLERTAEAMTVRIDWQRLGDDPRSGTLEAAIRPGERFPLDSVTSAASPACDVTGASLEATVIARAARLHQLLVALDGRDKEPDRLSEAARLLRSRASDQYQELVRLAPNAFQVELWLVQTRPDSSEQVQLITQPFGGSTSFVFPPVRVASPAGQVDVEVFGFLRHTQGDDGASAVSLQVAIGRNLRQQGARPVESYSASGKTVPWPAPAEVLSFELPVSESEQRLLGGYRFDLRLRLRPR